MMHLKRKDKEREKKKGKPKSTQRMLSDSLDKQDKNMEVAELKRKFDRLAVREDEPTSVKKLKLKLDTTEEEFASQSVESEIEEIGLDTGRIDNSVANYDYDAARIDSGEYLDAHDEEFDETGKKLCVLDSCLPSREWYRPSRLPRWLSAAEDPAKAIVPYTKPALRPHDANEWDEFVVPEAIDLYDEFEPRVVEVTDDIEEIEEFQAEKPEQHQVEEVEEVEEMDVI